MATYVPKFPSDELYAHLKARAKPGQKVTLVYTISITGTVKWHIEWGPEPDTDEGQKYDSG